MDTYNSINIIYQNNNNPFIRLIIGNINTMDDILNQSFNQENIVKVPTCKEFIKNLEELEIIQEDIDNNLSCAICQEKFKLGETVIGIPCKPQMHYFHCNNEECPGILPWLEENNTCPICRYELPVDKTDDTIDETIDDTIDETIDETINETMDETIHETIDETMDETINETMDETIDETNNSEENRDEIINIINLMNQPPIYNNPLTPQEIINNQEELINNMNIPQFRLFNQYYQNINSLENNIINIINEINNNLDDNGFSENDIDEAIRRSLNN